MRRPYTDQEDTKLVAFLAEKTLLRQGTQRSADLGPNGNYIYRDILVANVGEYFIFGCAV